MNLGPKVMLDMFEFTHPQLQVFGPDKSQCKEDQRMENAWQIRFASSNLKSWYALHNIRE